MIATEIRCYYCRALIIELAAPPWRFTCRRCEAKRSSTGLDIPPKKNRYQDHHYQVAS